ncbi:hypothetical protein [uncultured Bacteroides sp.]|jgi:hypothetical protein|uniref:hypothetical protein n=1 Tax=uncultured Bacteroides sp. TaxID=162156 RepID=UPI00206F7D86|nr:hypothetical protein [uncultured Bacteroides sp.]DAL45106.1 MAG TPA_asm: hypothetical protein [Caudoviricetes sp.]
MAQENVSDLFQKAKDLAKAEKELKVVTWVLVSIYRYDKQGNRTLLYRYDLPRELYFKREWVIRWREARFRCRFPKDQLTTTLSFYDKRFGTSYQLNEDLRKLASAKAQVSKVNRLIAKYISYQCANNMFFNAETDETLIKAKSKLAAKEAAVKAAEERMYNKIREIKSKRK